MTEFAIRQYHPSDLYMLYRICLETGADGDDATGTIDREILGHYFAAPYAVLDPALCFILTADGAPCGYILGTDDSVRFAERANEEWFPPLREKYPLRDRADESREAMMVRAIHKGYTTPPFVDRYPAHLHIDVLPVGQGQGQGPKLMERFLDAVRSRGAKGLHLGVSRGNTRATAWYPKLGFHTVVDSDTSLVYGIDL
ncbi:MAG: GNAT family N-acetyltransferase [Pseudomonadales bacterium]|nr:GNAT family N-acetyltransferase [Pseudomonadales bacterium]